MGHLSNSLEEDAAFCFPCRKFSDCGEKKAELSFCISGYRNWKCALDKSKAMSKWEEKRVRVKENREISSLVNENQLLKNRYYVTVIFDVIKFLASNELSFGVKRPSFGLFLRWFEFTLVRDTRLQEVIKYILEVATYELPEI
ncbi:hypothetical protein T11_5104 [Trichinella zimbabwensis]|uniref:Uncharacterized protein n=1 Tax=Trichinella zimbabwensis TaxID=268475 RepID=A0A0V1HYB1_9BILA|nr:hypothetical protein T11_5104 [Trichinella zimbabwensis]